MPSLVLAVIMGITVYMFNLINIAAWKVLGLQLVVGVGSYIGLTKIFRVESLSYLIATLTNLFKRRKYNSEA
jgi:hypothetical protein